MPRVICPYCGAEAQLKDSSFIYGRSYGYMYICSNYPECDAFVGCIRGTITPYGSLANKELRKTRKLAHIVFDRGWKSYGVFSRYDAYKKLAEVTGIDRPHIGEFSIEQCHAVVNFFTEFYKPYNRGRRPDEKRKEE